MGLPRNEIPIMSIYTSYRGASEVLSYSSRIVAEFLWNTNRVPIEFLLNRRLEILVELHQVPIRPCKS